MMHKQKLFEKNLFPLPKIDENKKIMFHNPSSQNCHNKDKKRLRANNKNKPSMTHYKAIKQFAMNQLEEAQQEPRCKC